MQGTTLRYLLPTGLQMADNLDAPDIYVTPRMLRDALSELARSGDEEEVPIPAVHRLTELGLIGVLIDGTVELTDYGKSVHEQLKAGNAVPGFTGDA